MKNSPFFFAKAFLLCLSVFASTCLNAQTLIPEAEIPVSYDVNGSGAFTYSVPLRMPPGANGLIPQLAVVYNSQGGNGLLGMGWSLTGLSMITRSNRTLYHHSSMDHPRFANDVYALDGQPLYQETTGLWMTWIKNYAKIEGHGTAANSPSYWTVETPEGLIFEYGNSTSSKMLAEGRTDGAVLQWALNKVSNRSGAYMEFEYYNSQTTGEYYISKIKYTANVGITAPTEVIFTYTGKPDINKTWMVTSQIFDRAMLDYIEIKHNSSLVNKYEFTYDNNTVSGDYAHLTKIEEIRGGSILPPININWGTPAYAAEEQYAGSVSTTNTTEETYIVGDFNGDGVSDYVGTPELANSSSNMDVYINTKSSTDNQFAKNTVTMNYSYSDVTKSFAVTDNIKYVIDYNGDGYDDMINIITEDHSGAVSPYTEVSVYCHLSNGSTLDGGNLIFLYTNSTTSRDIWTSGVRVLPGDFDGDGDGELYVLVPASLVNGLMPPKFCTGGFYPNAYFTYVVDEAVTAHSETLPGVIGTLYGQYQYMSVINNSIYQCSVLDFNGDGKTDILMTRHWTGLTGGECVIYTLNVNYTGFANTIAVNHSGAPTHVLIHEGNYPNHYYTEIMPGDFNGDGKTDLLTFHPTNNVCTGATTGEWHVAYSMGGDGIGTGWDVYHLAATNVGNVIDGSEPHYFDHPITSLQLGCGVYVADFNGDNKADILKTEYLNSTQTGYRIAYSRGYKSFEIDNSANSGLALSYAIRPELKYKSIGDFNGDGQADLFGHYLSTASTVVKSFVYFRKNESKHFVTSISHAGKTLSITTKSLPRSNNYRSQSTFQATYPYIKRVVPIKIVESLTDNGNLNKTYLYQNLVFHYLGLGMMGFNEVSIVDNSMSLVQDNYYRNTDDAYNPLPFLERWRTWDTAAFNNYYFRGNMPASYPFIEGNQHPDNNNGGCAHKVRNITPSFFELNDMKNGTYKYKRHHINFSPGSVGYDFGVADTIEESTGPVPLLDGTLLPGGPTNTALQIFTYSSGTLPVYLASKPLTCTTSTQRFTQTPYSRITNYQYNTIGLLEKVTTDPGTSNQNETEYLYDSWGNMMWSKLTASAFPAGQHVTQDNFYDLDGRFMVTSINNVFGYIEQHSYNDWGMLLTSSYGIGGAHIVTNEYDDLNRITKTKKGTRYVETNFTYGMSGGVSAPTFQTARTYVSSSTVGISGTNVSFFDLYGRKLRDVSFGFNGKKLYQDTKYNTDNTVEYATNLYDANDLTTKVITEFGYDTYKRCTTSTNLTSGVQIYTNYGLITSGIGGMQTTVSNTSTNQSKETVTDPNGTVVKVTNFGGGTLINTLEYFYHSNGKLEKQTLNGSSALESNYTYDPYGNLEDATEPNVGTTHYVTNSLGQLKTKTDADLNQWNYTYDLMGRVTSISEYTNATSTLVNYGYSYENIALNMPTRGKLLHVTSPQGHDIDYFYDPIYGELQTLTEGTFITQYTYDGLGRESSHFYPSGDITTRTYNAYGDLEKIDLASSFITSPYTIWRADTKDHLGNVTQSSYNVSGSPLTFTKTFDPLGFPLLRKLEDGATLLNSHSYNFSQTDGNLQSRQDDVRNYTEIFYYDGFDRLTQVNTIGTSSPQGLTVEYDLVGNIRAKTDVSKPAVPPYAHIPKFDWKYTAYALQMVQSPQTSTPQYAIPTTPQTEEYYAFDKIKKIEETPDQYEFEYYPDGRRYSMAYSDITVPTAPVLKNTKYYANHFEKKVDATTGDQELISYVFAGNEVVSMIVHKYGSVNSDNIYFPITDHLGSINYVYDQNNSLAEEKSFDAWGRPRDPGTYAAYTTSTMPTWMFDRGYTGHEHLFKNHIINMNGRLYDPLVGRMFSPDPILADNTDAQSYNKYSYVNNNPLKFTDPTGNVLWVPMLIMAAYMGAANVASHAGNIKDFKTGLGYFTIGFSASFLGGCAGAGVTVALGGMGGAIGGAASGVAGGAIGGFISSAGNSWVEGASFHTGFNAGLESGLVTAISGGIAGGILGGINGGWTGRGDAGSTDNAKVESTTADESYDESGVAGGGDDCTNEGKNICLPSYKKLESNYPSPEKRIFGFKNECSIRMSETFRNSDIDMGDLSKYPTFKGRITTARGFADWMVDNYGDPISGAGGKYLNVGEWHSGGYSKLTGIIYWENISPRVTGHVSLWNPETMLGRFGFDYSGTNGWKPTKVWFWPLK